MIRKSFLAVMCSVCTAFLLAACGSDEAAKAESKTVKALEVQEVRYIETPRGERYLTGSVHNPTGHSLSQVQVLVSLYDDQNRRVDEMNFLVEKLPAGQRTTFREPVSSEDDVRGARVRSLMKM